MEDRTTSQAAFSIMGSKTSATGATAARSVINPLLRSDISVEFIKVFMSRIMLILSIFFRDISMHICIQGD